MQAVYSMSIPAMHRCQPAKPKKRDKVIFSHSQPNEEAWLMGQQ